MGYTIIRPTGARDEYVVWCTSSDMPVWCGNRAELLAELEPDTHAWFNGAYTAEEMINYTDCFGSSSRVGHFGWWNDAEFIYRAQARIPRGALVPVCRMLAAREQLAAGLAQHDAAFARMMAPLDDTVQAEQTPTCTAPHAARKVSITSTGYRKGDDRTVDVHLHGPQDQFVHVVDALDFACEAMADRCAAASDLELMKTLRDQVNVNAGSPVAIYGWPPESDAIVG